MTKRTRIQTAWDLKSWYKNLSDPRIEEEVRHIEKVVVSFVKKYRNNKGYLASDTALLKALIEYESISANANARALLYIVYTKELESSNIQAEALLTKYDSRLRKVFNELLFFELSLGKLPKELQKKFLESKKLEPFHYYLQELFENAKHDLTEPEEKIMSLKSLPASSMWQSGMDRVLNKQTVLFRKKELPIAEAMNLLPNLQTKERRALHAKINETLFSISDFAEAEINALVTNKKINDELRGFKNPWSATILSYENDEKAIIAFTEAITKRFDISKRFFKVKQKMLGLSDFTLADRSANVGRAKKKIPFQQAVELCRSVFEEVNPLYRELFDRMLASGQIDVYPKKGKSGGAYCSSSINNPTMVLLNHVDDMRSLETLAHEMGHAIHSERSKTQRPLYQDYSTATAETASTFFEGLVFEKVFDSLPERDKIAALHDKIAGDVATIFRQIAFFNFEKELHTRVRAEGFLSKEAIAQLLNKHMRAYIGNNLSLTEQDGYFFVAVGHFRMFFYVYSYAYGQLISSSLRALYKAGKLTAEDIDKFLCAGGSNTPENIFASIGVDVTKPSFFKAGLDAVEADIALLESLVKKSGKTSLVTKRK